MARPMSSLKDNKKMWFLLGLVLIINVQSTITNKISVDIHSNGQLFLTDNEYQQFIQYQSLNPSLINQLNIFHIHLLNSIDQQISNSLHLEKKLNSTITTELQNILSSDITSLKIHDVWTNIQLYVSPVEQTSSNDQFIHDGVNNQNQQTLFPSSTTHFILNNQTLIKTTLGCSSYIPSISITSKPDNQQTLHGSHVTVQFPNGVSIDVQSNSSVEHPETQRTRLDLDRSRSNQGFLSLLKQQVSALQEPESPNSDHVSSFLNRFHILRSSSSVQYPSNNDGLEIKIPSEQSIVPVFDSYGQPMGFNFGNGGGATLPAMAKVLDEVMCLKKMPENLSLHLVTPLYRPQSIDMEYCEWKFDVSDLTVQSIIWDKLQSKNKHDELLPSIQSDGPNCKPIHWTINSSCMEICLDPEFVKSKLESRYLIPSSCLQAGYSKVIGRTIQRLPPVLKNFSLIEYTRVQNDISSIGTEDQLRFKITTFTDKLINICSAHEFLKDWYYFLHSIDNDLPLNLGSSCDIQHFITGKTCIELCVSHAVSRLKILSEGSCNPYDFPVFVSRRPKASLRLKNVSSSDVAIFQKATTSSDARGVIVTKSRKDWVNALSDLWTLLQDGKNSNANVLARLEIAESLPQTLFRPISQLTNETTLNFYLSQCALVHVIIGSQCIEFCVFSIDVISIINAKFGLCPSSQLVLNAKNHQSSNIFVAFISNSTCIQFEFVDIKLMLVIVSAMKNSIFSSCSQLGFLNDPISYKATIGLFAELSVEVFLKDDIPNNDVVPLDVQHILNSGSLIREQIKYINVIDWSIIKTDVDRATYQLENAFENNNSLRYLDVLKRFLSILLPLAERLNTKKEEGTLLMIFIKMNKECVKLPLESTLSNLLEILLPTSSIAIPSTVEPVGCNLFLHGNQILS